VGSIGWIAIRCGFDRVDSNKVWVRTCRSVFVTVMYRLFVAVCGQRAVMLCGWEGNCRSGVTLAMRHRLSGIPTYGLNGLTKGDEHFAYGSVEYGIFCLTLPVCRRGVVYHYYPVHDWA